ncbi:MAG: HD domain-containing protein [Planctomycetota bacterium]
MDVDAVWKRARADLALHHSRAEPDTFLWEHSERVARTAQWISGLDELQTRTLDAAAVVSAALYHDAGWVTRCRSGELDRLEILLTPSSAAVREDGAALLESSLRDLLPRRTLERGAEAVRACGDRSTDVMEAQVVAEADALEEFNLASIWLAVRRGAAEGKAVQAHLDTWRRKREYHYWDARLKDAFRFAATREAAKRRLTVLEEFANELDRQHRSVDLERWGAQASAAHPTTLAPPG